MFYYSNDEKVFPSKIEALFYKHATGNEISFYYYDDVYKSIDWTIEPVSNLQELYKFQAEKIRSEYDYVILCYSGGYDSNQILDTFYQNKIKLDKIVMIGSFSQDDDPMSDANRNLEARLNGIPYINQLGLENITEKIDYSIFFDDIRKLSIFNYGTEWFNHIGSAISPIHWFWNDIENYIVPIQWRDKKTAIIFGIERTGLRSDHNGKLGFQFTDAAYGNGITRKTDYSQRIMFFWDHNFPDIVIKQLHVQQNAMYKLMDKLKINKYEALEMVRKASFNMLCPKTGGMRSFLYSTPRVSVYKSQKSKNTALSLSDSFLMQHQTSDLYKFYTDGIKKLEKKIPINKIQYVSSRFYSIERD